MLLNNAAFKNDVNLLAMDKEDALIVFEEHIRLSEKEYLEERVSVHVPTFKANKWIFRLGEGKAKTKETKPKKQRSIFVFAWPFTWRREADVHVFVGGTVSCYIGRHTFLRNVG